jgi:hypothetical protein
MVAGSQVPSVENHRKSNAVNVTGRPVGLVWSVPVESGPIDGFGLTKGVPGGESEVKFSVIWLQAGEAAKRIRVTSMLRLMTSSGTVDSNYREKLQRLQFEVTRHQN